MKHDDVPEQRSSLTRLRVRQLLIKVAREPLLHFVVAGLLLACAWRLYDVHNNVRRIVVTPERVAKLAHDYALQFGVPPTPRLREALVQADIRDEILVREAQSMQLDERDEIIRRRIIQKMQFILQDTSAPADPTAAQLNRFYEQHTERYVSAPKATFSHIYFSPTADGADTAPPRAARVLASLRGDVKRAPDLGDAFPDLYDFAAVDAEQVRRLFGQSPLTKAVFEAPIGKWSGPYRSGYGWHLIYVDARSARSPLPLDTVMDRVRIDYLRDAHERANREAFDKLAKKFVVVRSDREHAP